MKISHNPAQVYLLSLRSEQSRTGMRSLLHNTVIFFDEDETVESFNWSKLDYPDIYKFISHLFDDKITEYH